MRVGTKGVQVEGEPVVKFCSSRLVHPSILLAPSIPPPSSLLLNSSLLFTLLLPEIQNRNAYNHLDLINLTDPRSGKDNGKTSLLPPHSNSRTERISHPRRSGGCERVVCRHWAYLLGEF